MKLFITAFAFAIASQLMYLPVLAQGASSNGALGGANLGEYMKSIVGLINTYIVPLVFAIAFIVFIWGVFQYFVLGGASEEKREEGKKLVMWGIIAFVVMLSLWGLVNLLVASFGFGGQNVPKLPTFNPPS
ncbi:pilin [Patescibacteria group bacterium]|nr:pilin [Patescibacteria group bacterium]MBU1500797.1 pilin [Patescibacteria group bacterium]MBU2080852.1 pilin [Patescibacteria group bacterium]MBU2123957.1 pilin [Patescibacteria group bacterium]MBU2194752.1 pilin [Patescibacteria group bacterium]